MCRAPNEDTLWVQVWSSAQRSRKAVALPKFYETMRGRTGASTSGSSCWGVGPEIHSPPSGRTPRLDPALVGGPDWARLDRGELSDDDVIVRAEVRTGIQAARLRVLFGTFPRALVPVDPVLELVLQARGGGNDLYVLSNLHRTSFERVRDELGIFELFDGSVVSCEVGAAKPEPAIYRRLLGDFDLDPTVTVFVDDTQVNLDAAAEFGIRTVLFTDAASCRSRLQALEVHLTQSL